MLRMASATAARVGEEGQQSKRELPSPEEPLLNQRVRRPD